MYKKKNTNAKQPCYATKPKATRTTKYPILRSFSADGIPLILTTSKRKKGESESSLKNVNTLSQYSSSWGQKLKYLKSL